MAETVGPCFAARSTLLYEPLLATNANRETIEKKVEIFDNKAHNNLTEQSSINRPPTEGQPRRRKLRPLPSRLLPIRRCWCSYCEHELIHEQWNAEKTCVENPIASSFNKQLPCIKVRSILDNNGNPVEPEDLAPRMTGWILLDVSNRSNKPRMSIELASHPQVPSTIGHFIDLARADPSLEEVYTEFDDYIKLIGVHWLHHKTMLMDRVVGPGDHLFHSRLSIDLRGQLPGIAPQSIALDLSRLADLPRENTLVASQKGTVDGEAIQVAVRMAVPIDWSPTSSLLLPLLIVHQNTPVFIIIRMESQESEVEAKAKLEVKEKEKREIKDASPKGAPMSEQEVKRLIEDLRAKKKVQRDALTEEIRSRGGIPHRGVNEAAGGVGTEVKEVTTKTSETTPVKKEVGIDPEGEEEASASDS